MAPEHALRPQWTPALMWLLALWAVLFLAYRDTIRSLIDIWSSSETYAHGAVVPLISLWLVWRMRHTVAWLAPQPALSALVPMAGAALLWLAGDMVAVNVVTHIAFITLVILAVPAVLGWAVARALTFPLLFLYFAAPVGDFMLPWLMDRTADFTVWALRLTGIPVYREGLQFVIPSGNWSVVEACSGIRYLIASLMVGCLFAYLSYRSARKRWLFMLVALLVPLLANWVRAYLIVLVGHLSGNELATGVDHLIYGWIFFGVVILTMLFMGARWADPEAPAPIWPATQQALAPSAHKTAWWPVALAALLLLLPHLALRGVQASVSGAPAAVAPLAASAPWQAQTNPASPWEPAFKNPAARWKSGFVDPAGQAVDLDISYYRQQSRDRKLVSSSNVVVTSNDPRWSKVDEGWHSTSFNGQTLRVLRTTLRDGSVGLTSDGQRLRVWRFYWVGDAFTTSDVQAKLRGVLQLLQGQGDDAAIVALSTPLDERLADDARVAAADQVLADFMSAQAQPLRAALQATYEAR
ncbi:exosortase A [Hydrogenophaga sp.]|uniref:exosortase A n=1 Tax=Hydrogenophaga sp. TaxID=1904254 RepID=UPI00286E657C|nr:exosortase A [Hydrogenophaga sp.]